MPGLNRKFSWLSVSSDTMDSRQKASIVPTLQRFATRQPPEEKEAWARLTRMLESNEELVNALHSLLAL